jgi:hypothetical protein
MCSFISDFFDNTLGSVGDFVENTAGSIGGSAGDFVENTAGSVLDYVGDQLQEIEDDPWKFAAKAAAVASGNAWALPIIEGVDTIEEGGTIGEGLLSAGKSYAGQQIGAELGSQFGGGGYGTGEDFNMGDGGYYTGEDFNMGGSLGDADVQPGGFYGGGEAPQATIIPGELGDIILDANGNVVTSSGSDILPAPSSFNISPGQALQALRGASGLLGKQQPQQQMPQMQMGGRTQMPQGAVDYSGIYNLLALQNRRNPNSLLG